MPEHSITIILAQYKVAERQPISQTTELEDDVLAAIRRFSSFSMLLVASGKALRAPSKQAPLRAPMLAQACKGAPIVLTVIW